MMIISLHKNARTTPAIRQEITNSVESASVLTARYNVIEQTIYKRKYHQDFMDQSLTLIWSSKTGYC